MLPAAAVNATVVICVGVGVALIGKGVVVVVVVVFFFFFFFFFWSFNSAVVERGRGEEGTILHEHSMYCSASMNQTHLFAQPFLHL